MGQVAIFHARVHVSDHLLDFGRGELAAGLVWPLKGQLKRSITIRSTAASQPWSPSCGVFLDCSLSRCRISGIVWAGYTEHFLVCLGTVESAVIYRIVQLVLFGASKT